MLSLMLRGARWFSSCIGMHSMYYSRDNLIPLLTYFKAWTSVIPCNQIKTRLHGKTKVSFVDVYVSIVCPEGVGIYEGTPPYILLSLLKSNPSSGFTWAWIPRSKTSRSSKAYYPHGIHWCLSTVILLLALSCILAHKDMQPSSCRPSIPGKALLHSYGFDRSFCTFGIDSRRLQRIQHSYTSWKRGTRCYWFSSDGQHITC